MLISTIVKVNGPLQEEGAERWQTTRNFGQYGPPSTAGASAGLATSPANSRSRKEYGSIAMSPMDVNSRPSNQPPSSSRPSRRYPLCSYSSDSSNSYGTEFISAFDSDCLHQGHEISEMRSPFMPLSSPASPLPSSSSPLVVEASKENQSP